MNNTVLIVDDVRLNIDVITSILGDDFKVMAAISGENAIMLLKRKKPDLVLLDISMPDITGFDVLQYMKESRDLSDIPVIFVTGEHDESIEQRGLALGAVDYIKKPFNADIVRVKVKNHIELKAHRDNLEFMVYERTKQLEERTRQLEKRTAQLTVSRDAIIMGMSLMSESRDSITGNHIERIKVFTKMITDEIIRKHPHKLDEDTASMIVLYSPLHDVGKIGISDLILNKKGKLTDEEFDIMKQHTLKGADLLRKTERFLSGDKDYANLEIAVEIAECHHEKYDGTGYPHGFKGDGIPLSARIVALADVYDALRSQRPYKEAFSHEEAVNIILCGDGRTEPSHFDPDVLDVFREFSDEFNKEYEKFNLNGTTH